MLSKILQHDLLVIANVLLHENTTRCAKMKGDKYYDKALSCSDGDEKFKIIYTSMQIHSGIITDLSRWRSKCF